MIVILPWHISTYMLRGVLNFFIMGNLKSDISIVCNDSNIVIYNSYKITSLDAMQATAFCLYKSYISKVDNNRTIFNLVNEWRTHNLLYTLGLFRTHTKDVNFEYKQKFILKLLYGICSLFYFHFK